MTAQAWILIAAIAAVLLVAFVSGFVLYRRRRISLTPAAEAVKPELTDRSGGYTASSGFSFSQGGGTATLPKPEPEPDPILIERTDTDGQPHIGDDAAIPRDSGKRSIHDIPLPEPVQGPELAPETAAVDSVTVEPATAEADTATRADTSVPGSTATAPADTAPPVTTVPAETADLAATETAVPTTDSAPAEAPTVEKASATPGSVAPVEAAPAATAQPAAPAPVESAAPAEVSEVPAAAEVDFVPDIEPTAGRLNRLRGRLARSQNAVGKSLLGLLGGGDLDEDSWEEIEDTLVMADLGTAVTATIVARLREEMAARTVRTADDARAVLREVLVEALRPELDRSIRALPHQDHPAVLLVVGVNGTGKTTTTGKLARVLVADGRRVLLGAADTFRAAAADQLQTWGERVGAETVRGKEAADPAAVAFDAVTAGIDRGVDVVLIDTAGRLHTKTGLMDELGKVKRVVEKKAEVDEVILVLDATVGQNGLMQARVFADVVDITGVALTKLDGTAKGGIVFQVQHELGVPVKLVGLGEGQDDLAPFEPGAFVDALLG
ncbi:signal recognition particle-docking protein FtsY [Nocardia sp. SYP-A9097]|uniref:signal recognition particle-docking protein FtsY n=1 Tax=Nocardia sp. SYP-A9097 TaxID=2663237 RepID=UPI0013243661|nr:signal recognition particle-docking protein FtsY [Nocardia sp. SYP-A9097]MRH90968.1 signal recognition particle-docking protein FtsY [Nocardia sp. SYP-A9097]